MGLLVTKGEHPHSKTFTEVLRQASKSGRKESIYLYNIPECIMALFIFFFKKKKKRVPHLIFPGPGEQIGVGKRGRGATSPLPLLFPDHPSLPSPSPGPVRYDEIRSLERSEVIGREDFWREISIHYTPFTSKGKREVCSCAPAEGRSFGSLPSY